MNSDLKSMKRQAMLGVSKFKEQTQKSWIAACPVPSRNSKDASVLGAE